MVEKNVVRELIEKLSEEYRDSLYLSLQDKVPYHNQKDNKSPIQPSDTAGGKRKYLLSTGTVGEIMCNLTTEAACLELLGVTKPCDDCPSECDSYQQFEDYLECVRVDKFENSTSKEEKKKYKYRTHINSHKELAKLFGVKVKYLNIKDDKLNYFKRKKRQQTEAVDSSKLKKWFIDSIKSHLSKGDGVMMSVFPSCKGHFVRVQSVTDEGLIVDDPYGDVKLSVRESCDNGYTPKNTQRNNKANLSRGNNILWKWSDLCKVSIKFFEIYSKN